MKLTSDKTARAETSPGRDVNRDANRNGFTLTELAVVIGMLAILVALMLPALAASKPGSSVAQCLNDKRQLSIAWQMYANDNSDSFMGTSWIPLSSIMDWTGSSANTNTAYLTNPALALIANYVQNAALFKCPADNYSGPTGPRVRSVSCNFALAGTSITAEGAAPGRGTYISAKKIMDLSKPGPANIFLFSDEHPDSINDGFLAVNPGYVATGERWRDLPASYHNGAAGISFTDGHCVMHTWQNINGQTVFPVLMKNYTSGASSPWGSSAYRHFSDYEWMEAAMPYH